MVSPLVVSSDLPTGLDPVAVKAACAAVRSYCGWHIAPSVTEDVTVDGPGGSLLLLPTLRLTAVNTVTNDGVAVTDPEWSAAGMIRGCWSSRFRGVAANITHGYDTCPEEIVSVVTTLASQSDMSGEASRVVVGPFSESYTTEQMAGAIGTSPVMRSVLDRYKLPPRP